MRRPFVPQLILAVAFSFGAGTALAADAAKPSSHHLIVAAEAMAAEAGRSMLRDGGTAVDAAIAAQLVLNLVEPQSSGIGGGAFLLLAEPNGTLRAYDGRESAPKAYGPDHFLGPDGKPMNIRAAVPGGKSVGVPGVLAMLAKAHAEYGKLPWGKLFEPAIALADKGFAVPSRLAMEIRTFTAVSEMPDTRGYFFHADGTPLNEGNILKNPAFAETLRQIAQGGPDAFYKGAIAQKIVDAVKNAPRNPGGMTREDLANYVPKERPSVCAPYRAYKVCALQAGSGGATVLEILGLLARFTPEQLKPGTLSNAHLISEASRLAYADRARWLGDPDFTPAPFAGLLDAGYLNERSQLIDPAKAMGIAAAGMPPMKKTELFAPQRSPTTHGTSHLSVVDDAGAVVSMTTSIESAFGAKLIANGFLLNNELTDFSFEPVIDGMPVANAVAGGKRPLSAMSPMIVFGPDGKFFAAIGSPGGSTIIAYVTEDIIALIDGQMSMQEAVSLPHHVNRNGPTTLEEGTPLVALAPQLTAMGHEVRINDQTSGLNGIRRVPGGYEGGSDPRRSGVALGD